MTQRGYEWATLSSIIAGYVWSCMDYFALNSVNNEPHANVLGLQGIGKNNNGFIFMESFEENELSLNF